MTQIKKNNKDIKSILRLSIQVSLSGLSFCILNSQNNTLEYLKAFSFDRKFNPNELLGKLKHLFNTENELNQSFEDVNVIHKNELATIVPKPLFDEDNLADYLKFNNKILSTDFITFDTIDINDSINVYVPYVNINNYLYDRFGEFTYKHFSTIFIEQVLKAEKHTEKPKMHVNLSNDYFEIVVTENGKLSFYNTFEYQTKEDFIYYILFTAEQLKLNPESFELVLTGNINSSDELYAIAYKYIRHVSFGKNEVNFNYSENAQPTSQHSEFVILNSF